MSSFFEYLQMHFISKLFTILAIRLCKWINHNKHKNIKHVDEKYFQTLKLEKKYFLTQTRGVSSADCFSTYKHKLPQIKLIHWLVCFPDPLGWLRRGGALQILINVALWIISQSLTGGKYWCPLPGVSSRSALCSHIDGSPIAFSKFL